MALPTLFNGADCGPSNPLQGLSKQFDRDRGLQQDHFGPSHAGPSRESFRTQAPGLSSADKNAASRFFSSGSRPTTFDLAALQRDLPALEPQIYQAPKLSGGWANDFLMQQPAATQTAGVIPTQDRPLAQNYMSPGGPISWNPMVSGLNTRFMPVGPMQLSRPTLKNDGASWDKEFEQQHRIAAAESIQQHESPPNTIQEADDLSRTAGLLLETVKDEQNPKFKNSMFMGLMRQLRDREIVVEGNEMVENHGQVDVKGKRKAVESIPISGSSYTPLVHAIAPDVRERLINQVVDELEDQEDAFWRQETADYIKMSAEALLPHPVMGDSSWHHLQDAWDQLEPTATGIRASDQYRFQENNPYLLGQSSRTFHHRMHDGAAPPADSVLELEAAVQQNMNDASAWFELGVKQQENEREKKALQALSRALELDPTHLPTWLALAISHTNDGNRFETYEAIHEWVKRNNKYTEAFHSFPEIPQASYADRFNRLVDCLMAMARTSSLTGAIDADIQIALAVLFNANEDYGKAQDCFRTALAVRPHDWLLYNRVGATIANSGQPAEALEYYHAALELNPGYIRARYNLGISCINLRRYEEAAQHIINALVLQESDGVRDQAGSNETSAITSIALWDSLKTVCIHMQRVDLTSICDRQDIGGAVHFLG
ncbi:hypothetical protein C8J56DRAFT_1160936 [Mycena floridula]|nr:hypothetical protein C8J56DRAFT_1160936 [Mycena floridula]